jgi:hypothetical protein
MESTQLLKGKEAQWGGPRVHKILGTTLLFLFYSKLGLSLVLAALIKKEPVWKGDKSWHVLLGHIIVTFGFIGLAYQGKRILCLDSV